jgi:CubicO group peptidase (beta-lactamase class C family)
MAKPKTKLKRWQFLVVIMLLIPGLVWVLTPAFLKKAAIHQLPGIHDYRIFHNRTVEIGMPQPWPQATRYNQTVPDDHFLDSLLLMETTAFLVIQNDSILFEYYADGVKDSDISNSFSAAKSIVGLLIGCAIDDGYIKNVNQSVDDLLPDYPKLHNQGLLLKHLLTMSSGSDWDEAYSTAFSITTKAYYGNHLPRLMKEVEIEETPGETFSYRSGDTQLLALILTRATGKTLSDYAAEKLWKPMGAETEVLWSLDRKNGMEKAYCCFNSHARDFARMGQLLLNKGAWKGQQLISKDYLAEAVRPATHLKDTKGKAVTYYGYQWWLMDYKHEMLPYARGILGQYIFTIPSRNAVIVRLGHLRSDTRMGEHPTDAYTWVNLGLSLMDQL